MSPEGRDKTDAMPKSPPQTSPRKWGALKQPVVTGCTDPEKTSADLISLPQSCRSGPRPGSRRVSAQPLSRREDWTVLAERAMLCPALEQRCRPQAVTDVEGLPSRKASRVMRWIRASPDLLHHKRSTLLCSAQRIHDVPAGCTAAADAYRDGQSLGF